MEFADEAGFYVWTRSLPAGWPARYVMHPALGPISTLEGDPQSDKQPRLGRRLELRNEKQLRHQTTSRIRLREGQRPDAARIHLPSEAWARIQDRLRRLPFSRPSGDQEYGPAAPTGPSAPPSLPNTIPGPAATMGARIATGRSSGPPTAIVGAFIWEWQEQGMLRQVPRTLERPRPGARNDPADRLPRLGRHGRVQRRTPDPTPILCPQAALQPGEHHPPPRLPWRAAVRRGAPESLLVHRPLRTGPATGRRWPAEGARQRRKPH